MNTVAPKSPHTTPGVFANGAEGTGVLGKSPLGKTQANRRARRCYTDAGTREENAFAWPQMHERRRQTKN